MIPKFYINIKYITTFTQLQISELFFIIINNKIFYSYVNLRLMFGINKMKLYHHSVLKL